MLVTASNIHSASGGVKASHARDEGDDVVAFEYSGAIDVHRRQELLTWWYIRDEHNEM